MAEFAVIMQAEEARRSEDDAQLCTVINRYTSHLEREGRQSTLALARTLLDQAIIGDLLPDHWRAARQDRMATLPGARDSDHHPFC